ncbi:radical SAM protein [Treponema sp. OMZ 840]|uniref:KamA family radical SAM protein n=1 Tax=Treponema sp. OMZ 840 TaxID=244313 RepID=UPI003D8C46DE
MIEQISPHWRSVMERLEAALEHALFKSPQDSKPGQALNALRKQLAASNKENIVLPYENDDPLGSALYSVHAECGKNTEHKNGQYKNRIIHQYKNRCLFVTTGRCFARCRYCFRRNSSALDYPFASAAQIDELCAYIGAHSEVREVLLSGGDPLTGSDTQLEALLGALRSCRADLLIRVCTRAPVFAPERFTPRLLALLKAYKPLWLIPHINHAAEFSPDFAPEAHAALSALAENGIPMQSQTVLLRGINDNLSVLSDLFTELTLLGIKPGYLFQGDLAPGTSHFRVPIDEGLKLYEQLRAELSGLSTPVYSVDIPGGGGKFNLLQLHSRFSDMRVETSKNAYIFRDNRGFCYRYPIEI